MSEVENLFSLNQLKVVTDTEMRPVAVLFAFQSAPRPCDRGDCDLPNWRSRKCFVTHFRKPANSSRVAKCWMSKNDGNYALPLGLHLGAKPRPPSRHLWFAEATS